MLLELGIFGILIFIVLIPIILTIIVGIGLANAIGLSGIFWWAFVILFYMVIGAILGAVGKASK